MAETKQKTTNSAERVYAEALLQMADAEGKLGDVAKEIKGLGELIESNPDLKKLLSSRVLSANERAGSIENIFKSRTSDLVYRFLRVVNDKDRLGDLEGIIRAFAVLHDEHSGIVEVQVYTAKQLDAAHVKDMTERLGIALKKQVVIHQHVDPTLIGGLKLQIGDEIVDGSVVAQLKIMKDRMITSGLEKARVTASLG